MLSSGYNASVILIGQVDGNININISSYSISTYNDCQHFTLPSGSNNFLIYHDSTVVFNSTITAYEDELFVPTWGPQCETPQSTSCFPYTTTTSTSSTTTRSSSTTAFYTSTEEPSTTTDILFPSTSDSLDVLQNCDNVSKIIPFGDHPTLEIEYKYVSLLCVRV